MPELPEVESTRRHLLEPLEGHRIDGVEVTRARMVRRQPRPQDFTDRSVGRRVVALDRRGKFMLWRLEGDLTTVVHLGMSGRIRLAGPTEPRDPHTNVVWSVEGREVRLVDPRTFGFVACFTPEELDVALGGVGADALTGLPDDAALADLLAGRRAPIKALLLDQRLVAGLGNIYADESLHRAGIDPRRPGGTLDRAEVAALAAAIPQVLDAALARGGTSLDDLAYLLPDGRAGEYVGRLGVYGRTGAPCRRCGTAIERAVVAQRSTHWCPRCQS
jgi:formamidopyrimidine-DNA glycosylase